MMIDLDEVWFGYVPEAPILAGVSLELHQGLTLLVGPNGCGKSTLLKIAAGVEHPDRGRVRIAGADMWQDEIAARNALAYLPEQAQVTPYATVSEVLALVAGLRRQPLSAADEALRWAGLGELGKCSVRELSMGQQRRALLAAVRISGPQCLLLDEPLEGMDRRIRGDLLAWLGQRLAEGATVIVASHQIEPFAALATRVVTVIRGLVTTIEPLPDSTEERLDLIELLARGEIPP